MKSLIQTIDVSKDASRLVPAEPRLPIGKRNGLAIGRVAAPRLKVLHEIFERQADARPEAVAVVFGREEVTYGALESRANRLARNLHGRGEKGTGIAELRGGG